MNLSYWERTAFFQQTDYCIVGAGIVGLFAALEIKNKQPDAKVLVLERSLIPDGASTKNAGFACFGSLSELIAQAKKSSDEEIVQLVNKRYDGLKKLRSVLGDDAIDYKNFGGFEIFTNRDLDSWEECHSKMKNYNDLLKDIFHKDVYQPANQLIDKFEFKNVEQLIFNPFEAQINSGKMMKQLINTCRLAGVEILFGANVLSIKSEKENVEIVGENFELKTDKLIVCTNAFAKDLLPNLDLYPGRGQVFITKEIKNLKLEGAFHYNEGYFYFRNIDNRVLIGGGRNLNFEKENTIEYGNTDEIKNEITRLLNENILPNTNWEFDMEWSGIMAFGKETTPIVKQVQPRIFCAVRCNGMGVAIGSIIGEEIAALCLTSNSIN